MGNDLIKEINPDLQNLDQFILNQDYQNANNIYLNIKGKLINIKNEEKVNKLKNYLLTNISNSKYQFLFSTLITNLKINHKIPFLIELIYENKLIDSIDNIKINSNSNIIIRQSQKKLNKEKNINIIRDEIELKMKKILEINKYINLAGFQSIMYEMMAEKYYNLASANYNKFSNKKNQTSRELEEIILEFNECINNYKITGNNKIKKLEQYEDSLKRVTSHYNVLKGK